jgi:fatty acid desaturase
MTDGEALSDPGWDLVASEEGTIGAAPSAELRALCRLRSGRSLAAVAGDWLVVVLAYLIARRLAHPAVWILGGLVVAARQHALLILMHDAAHHRLLPGRRWNDRLSDWLCAWPLLVTTAGYRRNHVAHHRHLGTDDDPDWRRKKGRAEWRFPQSRRALTALLLRDFFGGGMRDIFVASAHLSRAGAGATTTKRRPSIRLVYYLVVAGLLIAAGAGAGLLFWFIPAFTALPVILRMRSIAEHFALPGALADPGATRNTHYSFIERLFLAPHNVGYHLDHHLHSAVPFYNLPALHRLLGRSPVYRRASHQSHGFWGGAPDSVINEIAAAPAAPAVG